MEKESSRDLWGVGGSENGVTLMGRGFLLGVMKMFWN